MIKSKLKRLSALQLAIYFTLKNSYNLTTQYVLDRLDCAQPTGHFGTDGCKLDVLNGLCRIPRGDIFLSSVRLDHKNKILFCGWQRYVFKQPNQTS